MTPITKNLTIYKGITFKLRFKAMTKSCCDDGSGVKTPIDLSDFDVFMQIRKAECGSGDHELILDLNDPESLIQITNPEEGEILILIPGEVSKEISSSRPLTYWAVLKNRITEESFILMLGSVCFIKPIVIIP